MTRATFTVDYAQHAMSIHSILTWYGYTESSRCLVEGEAPQARKIERYGKILQRGKARRGKVR